MRRKVITLLVTTLPSLSSHAALPPTAQRIAEMRAILNHLDLYKSVPPYTVLDRIEYADKDLYKITMGNCQLDALIKDAPISLSMPGPRRFYVTLGETICQP